MRGRRCAVMLRGRRSGVVRGRRCAGADSHGKCERTGAHAATSANTDEDCIRMLRAVEFEDALLVAIRVRRERTYARRRLWRHLNSALSKSHRVQRHF